MAKHLYFAAPLFSDAELQFNRQVVSRMEISVPVFLPQRDGGLIVDLMRNGIDHDTAYQQVASIDLKAIRDCIAVVAVLDGQSIDEGVAFEIGYAHAIGKRCIALITDPRRGALGFCNPMVQSALARVFRTEEDLLQEIRSRFAAAACDA